MSDTPLLGQARRPLGPAGMDVRDRAVAEGLPDDESLLMLCGQVDERVALRMRVFRDPEAPVELRKQLRDLDVIVRHRLWLLGLAPGATDLVDRYDDALDHLELSERKKPLAALGRAYAICIDAAALTNDPHGAAALGRELRLLYHELTGPTTEDPLDELLLQLSTPMGDTPPT